MENHTISYKMPTIYSRFKVKNSVYIAARHIEADGKEIFHTEQADFDAFSKESYQQLTVRYPKFFKMDPVCKLAMLAMHTLHTVCHQNCTYDPTTAVILANKHSTWDNDLAHYQSIQTREAYFPSPAIFAYTLPNIAAGEICIRYQLKGENIFFVMDEPDWSFLVEYADNILETTTARACLIGWADCALPHYQAIFFWIER